MHYWYMAGKVYYIPGGKIVLSLLAKLYILAAGKCTFCILVILVLVVKFVNVNELQMSTGLTSIYMA